MAKIRILIVDDAVVIRKLVADCLSSDPDLEVVGTAANGRIALGKISQFNPQLVTLDVEMPEMDGLQTLAAIRKTHPQLPVIMFSTLTERGAAATLDALALGANDYLTKPANVGSVGAALQRIRDELIPKIKALCQRSAVKSASIPKSHGAANSYHSANRAEVVAIGVSTGGPNALAALLPGLTKPFPVPIVIVQHMPPLFTRLLAERLAALSSLPAREASGGELLRPGEIWVAPGGLHMEVEQTAKGVRLHTYGGPPENSCRPAVDVLFRSVAKVYRSRSLAVVLTGMGQDGLGGCQSVREAGGRIIVQDEATSVVWGMPGSVSQAGLANAVLPLGELAGAISRCVYGPQWQSMSANTGTVLPAKYAKAL